MRRTARTALLSSYLPARLRHWRAVRSIRMSGLCDVDFYYDRYPDVREASLDPVHHYVHHGAAEGRDPHPCFDTAYYLVTNPDVAEAGWNPLHHFISHGWSEGRSSSPDRKLARSFAQQPSLRESPGRFAVWRLALASKPSAPTISVREIHASALEASASAEPRTGSAGDPIVVVVAHVCPSPPRQGNEYRIQRCLRWLESRGYQTLFVCCPLPGEELDEQGLVLAADGLSNFIYCDRQGVVQVSLAPHLRDLVSELDGTAARPLSHAEARRCAPECELSSVLVEHERAFCPDMLLRVLLHIDARLPEPGATIANYVVNTRYLPLLKPSRLKILDTIDVFSSRVEKVSPFGVENFLAISSQEERALLLRADVVMAIQPEEARVLTELVPERRVIDVGVDFDTAPEAHAALPSPSSPQRVLMLASANSMNVRGLADFLVYVWPLVLREHPDAELLVGGAVSEFVPEGSPNVSRLGYVDSLGELYRGCRLAINPAVAGYRSQDQDPGVPGVLAAPRHLAGGSRRAPPGAPAAVRRRYGSLSVLPGGREGPF